MGMRVLSEIYHERGELWDTVSHMHSNVSIYNGIDLRLSLNGGSASGRRRVDRPLAQCEWSPRAPMQIQCCAAVYYWLLDVYWLHIPLGTMF